MSGKRAALPPEALFGYAIERFSGGYVRATLGVTWRVSLWLE